MDHTQFIQIVSPETSVVYALDAAGGVWVYTTREETRKSAIHSDLDVVETRYGWAQLNAERFPPKPPSTVAKDNGIALPDSLGNP